MPTFRWVKDKLVDIEDHPKIADRWMKEGKYFDIGDKVVVLDKHDDKPIVGYEWDPRFEKQIGHTRTIKSRVVNYYGYICGYRLKKCPGIYSPDFLMRKERAR